MIYTLHLPEGMAFDPFAEDALDAVEAVPESVSLLAILFPLPWLLWYRLWMAAAVYCVVLFALLSLLATPYRLPVLILAGLPGVYLWLEGHNLRRNRLERQGYRVLDVVEAPDERSALARFLAKRRDQADLDRMRLSQIGLAA